MSSAFNDQFAAVAHELHQQWFGDDSIRHWPGGEAGQQATITAEWEPDPAQESLSGGRHLEHRGKLRVDAELVVTREDKFVINGELYQVTTIGLDEEDGTKLLGLQISSGDLRRGARERL